MKLKMISYFAQKPPKKSPSLTYAEETGQRAPVQGREMYFIMLWKWIGKRTSRLMCHEQVPGDGEDGPVGLGAGGALRLSSEAPQLFYHSFPLEIKGELPGELSLSWDTLGHVVVPKVLLPLCGTGVKGACHPLVFSVSPSLASCWN